jgi:hypothetical protein
VAKLIDGISTGGMQDITLVVLSVASRCGSKSYASLSNELTGPRVQKQQFYTACS